MNTEEQKMLKDKSQLVNRDCTFVKKKEKNCNHYIYCFFFIVLVVIGLVYLGQSDIQCMLHP